MKKSLLYFWTLSVISFCSCSKNEEIYDSRKSNSTELFNLIIKYNNNQYNVQCTTQADSLMFLDKTFNELYKSKLENNPKLATLLYETEDGTSVVEYFDSAEELEQTKGLAFVNNEQSRAVSDPISSNTIGRAILYDDTNFSDTDVTLDITPTTYYEIPNLKDYARFNDKTSSIRVFNFLNPSSNYSPAPYGVGAMSGSALRTCLISFEDTDFDGKVLYCISKTYQAISYAVNWDVAYHQDYNLKRVGWNDKISSVVFRIVTVSDINSGEYINHN